ncbi:MAG: ABC transporter permease [Chitinispirillaceae bacterium]|nr:ABC transporter permease [Chitinispirillaceae bacterium]
MMAVVRIALRNLLRYRRRTILVSLLIAIGVVAVQVFLSVSGSYKEVVISQITDAVLGHMQIHRKGYVAAIDNIPLHLNLTPEGAARIEKTLKATAGIEAYSRRIRCGGMLSNFTETVNIRLYGIEPQKEYATVPLLPKRVIQGSADFKPGEILVPALLARGLKLKVNDPVVIIATNVDGSVNGMQFTVAGIVETVPGPGGRDGYIHFSDAVQLLRMETPEVSEIAVRVAIFNRLNAVMSDLSGPVLEQKNSRGMSMFEMHGWEKLSPFANIAGMIDLMSLFVRIVLVAIVLVSIMDVMMMSVYERTREIGTLAAIGTPPGRILALFITEGALLGVAGVIVGTIISWVIVLAISMAKPTFAFGMRDGFVLHPSMQPVETLTISIIVLVVAVIASLQPAVKASRLDPIKALKTV